MVELCIRFIHDDIIEKVEIKRLRSILLPYHKDETGSTRSTVILEMSESATVSLTNDHSKRREQDTEESGIHLDDDHRRLLAKNRAISADSRTVRRYFDERHNGFAERCREVTSVSKDKLRYRTTLEIDDASRENARMKDRDSIYAAWVRVPTVI